MKISEHWLRERLHLTAPREELLHKLTLAGLEVNEVIPVANPFTSVVVAEVLAVEPHPDADRLRVCQVNVGSGEALQIVCGAKNVRPGIKVPAALVGAVLSPELTIKSAALRGVASQGMLCAADELGLGQVPGGGLLELPADAPVGEDLRTYLQLNDDVTIDIDLTPNRSDCLSLEGIARETAALFQLAYTPAAVKSVPSRVADRLSIEVAESKACPRYAGRIIKGINASAKTPLWMQELLRRSGIRAVNPVVDVANYVMLMLGQPLHAFDLARMGKTIRVRFAKENEALTLLDDRKVTLDAQSLVIADEEKALALAGVMGGADSAVTTATQDIFLESAFFNPLAVAGVARRYGLHTDASLRFERGVDPELPVKAIEYATDLLLQIVGGEAGEIVVAEKIECLPTRQPIELRRARIERLLGITINDDIVARALTALGMDITPSAAGWQVHSPSYRFDIQIEEDLIEEVARIHGYDHIPDDKMAPSVNGATPITAETHIPLRRWRSGLVDRDYREIISYSFVAPKLQQLLTPHLPGIALQNPLSTEMGVMRSSLWPGLVSALSYNQHRQQSRVRLFESGLCFNLVQGELKQEPMLAGVCWGTAFSENWSNPNRAVDFFDIKGDLEYLFALTKVPTDFRFSPSQHPALHPGQAADIWRGDQLLGQVGALHPQIGQQVDLPGTIYLFELNLSLLETAILPKFATLSKYPAIRRDIAVWVSKTKNADHLVEHIRAVAGSLLVGLSLFDVYQGQGERSAEKSLAFGLILQEGSRTLVDGEVNELMEKVIHSLAEKFGAVLRD